MILLSWKFFVFAGFSILLVSCASRAALEQDQALIDEMMTAQKGYFDQCFVEARRKNPQLTGGHLILRVEHTSDGRFVAPRPLKSFPGFGPVADCISDRLAQTQTDRPRTRGPVDLEWLFEFNTRTIQAEAKE